MFWEREDNKPGQMLENIKTKRTFVKSPQHLAYRLDV